ncbi:MAG: hypothetical protein H6Q48_4092 [Deltaproteobacteria bacterium]|nr:hypothetical protein [Deltaproteobacteria bacterium]
MYLEVRRNDEGRGTRRRWVFFSNLLKEGKRFPHPVDEGLA